MSEPTVVDRKEAIPIMWTSEFIPHNNPGTLCHCTAIKHADKPASSGVILDYTNHTCSFFCMLCGNKSNSQR